MNWSAVTPGLVPLGVVTKTLCHPAACAGDTAVTYNMSEFFIRKAHRRAGIGRDAATLIFDRFAGDWEIVEYLRNPGAVTFWRRVLTAYTKSRFTERSRNGEVRQRFTSRPTPSR